MTEQTNRAYWSPEEQYQHQRELAARRERWEAQKKVEAEQAERDRKRSELDAYLRDRGQQWMDVTGVAPSTAVLARWTEAYLDLEQLQREAEREARLADSEQQHYNF